MITLEDKIGYIFSNRELLSEALLHPSHPTAGSRSQFQRLEYFGDSVLGFFIRKELLRSFPYENEGALTHRESFLVSTETCLKVAERLGLDEYLLCACPSDMTRSKMLADAVEALLGAMNLDGGEEPCRRFVETYWKPLFNSYKEPPKDSKSQLQERLQLLIHKTPVYAKVEMKGEAHQPCFTCSVEFEGNLFYGCGGSIQSAQQDAAKNALEWLRESDEALAVLPDVYRY